MKGNLKEDNLSGRQPEETTNFMEDASMEYDFNGRQPHWNEMHLKICIQLICSRRIYLDQL
jgi:hypothetical protein